jgi:hypothetical protein
VAVIERHCLDDPLCRLGRPPLIGGEGGGSRVPLLRSTRSPLLQSTKYRHRREGKLRNGKQEKEKETKIPAVNVIVGPLSLLGGSGEWL